MYRPWGSHSHLLPMVSPIYCLCVCSVIVASICIKKIFRGQRSNLRTGTSKLFTEDTACKYCFQIHERREYCERFADIAALRANDSCCYFVS